MPCVWVRARCEEREPSVNVVRFFGGGDCCDKAVGKEGEVRGRGKISEEDQEGIA